jgi:metallo-beta-lactamase family protein
MTKKLKLSFHGGTRMVTGSNFLLESEDSKIVVDCGLFQGCDVCDKKNREDFKYNPSSIDVVFITHSHIDHIGRLPKLVRDGFRGTIYSTLPAKDIAEVMFQDSLKVFGVGTGERDLPPIYTKKDVEKTMELWEAIDYGDEVKIKEEFTVKLKNSGHVLGSSMVEVSYNGKKLVFTGDLGNSSDSILCDAEVVSDADYMIVESVYGDRTHEKGEERKQKLEDVIEETFTKKGVLMIPAFSLERTQQLLFDLNELVEHSRIPIVSIFLDSPLAIKITEIYKKYTNFFNDKAKKIIKSGDDIFRFANLRYTITPEESIAISKNVKPKVIIAGSGMSTGGRIVFHEKRYLPDPNSTLLIVGYQAAGTTGREIQEGAKTVKILNEDVTVNARIETINGYSAHQDSEDLIEFVKTSVGSLKKIFVVQGEPSAALFLAQKIKDYVGVDAHAPEEHETIELEC